MSRRSARPRSVAELGEFPLIERLAVRLGEVRSDVVVGIGDDVAAIEIVPERLLLITCDAQVGGSHFLVDRCDPRRLGRKAAAINVSDIAAAGGRPTHFLSSLVLPAETEVAFVEALYDGLAEEAGRWGADVVGGNVSRGDSLVIDLTLLGEVAKGDMLGRDGARVGDRIVVTGSLGAAAAGLHLKLNPELEVEDTHRVRALDAFETPTPRLPEALALVAAGGVRAAIDVSDGLAADLGHVCDRSAVGVRVDATAIPIDDAAKAVARASALEAIEWALGGGEDYELVLAVAAERAPTLLDAVVSATGTPATVIGEIVPAEQGRKLQWPGGRERSLTPEGWRHF